MMPLTVQLKPTLLAVPVAVKQTVAPPPLPQLCAWEKGAIQNASNRTMEEKKDFIFIISLGIDVL
jgi:hypothetical protein